MNTFRTTGDYDMQNRILSDDDYLTLLGHPINSILNNFENSTQYLASTNPNLKRKNSYRRFIKSKTLKNFEIEHEQELNRKKHSKFVIKQNSYFLIAFNFLKGLLIIYSVTSTLFFLAFFQQEKEFFGDRLVWSFFVLDFLLQFFIEKREKNNRKILNLKMISLIYLKTWLIPDLLALIPYSWFKNPNVEFSFRLLRIFKMNFLFKLLNMKTISKLMAKFFSTGQERTNKTMVFAVLHVWDLVSEISILIFITYFLACIWMYYTDFINRKFNPSPNFFENFSMDGDTQITKMIKVWYFIFCTLCTSGFGDFFSVNSYEMSFNTIIILIGPTWYAYTSSKVFKILNDLYNLKKNINKKDELSIWISGTESKHRRMNAKLRLKINDFYLNYWKNDRLGNMSNIITETNSLEEITQVQHYLLKVLPAAIQNKIFDFLFDDIFYSFTYLFDRSSEWKYCFAVYLQPRVYFKGKKIVKIDQEVSEVLFVTEGKFDIAIIVNKEFIQVKKMNGKCIIGDYFVIKGAQSFFKYTALSAVHGFAVPAFVFKALVKVAGPNFNEYFKALEKNFGELLSQVVYKESDSTDLNGIESCRTRQKLSTWREDNEEQEGGDDDIAGLKKIEQRMRKFRNCTLSTIKDKLIIMMELRLN